MRRLIATFAALALLVACGDDDGEEVQVDDPAGTTTTTEADTTTTDTTTTTETTTTTTRPDDEDLPGEVWEAFPYEDAEMMVVGVEAGDELNVRAGPSVDFDVVAELDPLATGVVATGHNRQLDDGSIWAEVRAEGVTGWANTAFLAHPGPTEDATAQLFPDSADLPRAETMGELADAVAAAAAPTEPGMEQRVVVVDGPSVGDLGEVTVDVLGYADDSHLGDRLHVFATPGEGGGSFTVRTVERTVLCRRGGGELCL